MRPNEAVGRHVIVAVACVALAGGALADETHTEGFDSGFTTGQTVGSHADWYDGGSGPVVTSGNGVDGSVGLAKAGTIFTWSAHPFNWSSAAFRSATFQMDYQTDGSGHFDDDRMGWMTSNSSTSSSDIFGVQMDPGGGAYCIEGYWDGVSAADKRPHIVDLPALSSDSWYRLNTEVIKLTDTSARIDVELVSLDGGGNPGGTVASGSIADTSKLGDDEPNAKYFGASLYAAYKNHTAADGAADNAAASVHVSGVQGIVAYTEFHEPEPKGDGSSHNYYAVPPECALSYDPGTTGSELGFATGSVTETQGAGSIHTLGAYDSGTSPELFRMRTVEATTTLDTVNLTGRQDVTASIQIRIKSTSYEDGDYFRAILDSGSGTTLDLARVEGAAALNAMADNTYRTFTVNIPDDWAEATLAVASYTNSSADSESVDFDGVYFRAAAEAGSEDAYHFTVTADMREEHTYFGDVCQAVNALAGGPGLFHVSPGDIDGSVQENRDVIDAKFGPSAVWIPGIGNHECDSGSGADIEWLRTEYDTGHDVRTPLKDFTNADGPAGTERLCYTWDDAATNSHFIMLNEYWNGGTNEGSGTDLHVEGDTSNDTAADGDIVEALRTWLATDLAANQDKAIFVFGHEPAFPENRHVGDSLDAEVDNRDAFWALLEQYDVLAYMCGHTHYYSRHEGDTNGDGDVWQIDLGNAGNDSGEDKFTFLDVVLLNGEVRFDVYQSPEGDSDWSLAESWSVPANSVPEPSTLAILAAGAALVLLRRRQGRSG